MIQSTTLGTSYATSAQGLYDFLTANAVPKYFSNVTLSSGVITCYVDDVAFLTITSTSTPLKVQVTTEWGFTRAFTLASRYFQTAYLCSGGITLACDNNLVPAFTICKDTAGNTTLVYCETLTVAGTGSTSNLWSINVNTTSPTIQNAYQTIAVAGRGDFVKTVLAPILVNGNDGDYVTDVQIILTAQFTMSGNYNRTWVIDGVNYFSNGLWVVSDEQEE